MSGSLEKTIRNGFLKVKNGTINLLQLENVIYGIKGNLEIINNQLTINYLTALSEEKGYNDGILEKLEKSIKNIFYSKEKVKNDIIVIEGSMDLEDFFNPGFKLQMSADRLLLSSSENIFEGYGKMELSVNGKDTIFVTGKFEPSANDFSVLMEFGGEKEIVPEKVNAQKIIDYDIHIPLDNGIMINNSQMDGLIDGDIVLTATGIDPFIFSGNINVVDVVILINVILEVESDYIDCFDVNGDGLYDILDVVLIVNSVFEY